MTQLRTIHSHVKLGSNSQIGEYVLLGEIPAQTDGLDLKTVIGDHAIIRSHTVIYWGNHIGHHLQTGHGVLIRECNTLGDYVSVGSHSVIEHHTKIEDGVRIHSNVFIPEFSTLEKECWIGPSVTITNAKYPRSRNVKENLVGAHVGRGAKIGAGAVLLPGITIGENALIGAGAVVVSDVPAGGVIVGNPGRMIKTIEDIPEYR